MVTCVQPGTTAASEAPRPRQRTRSQRKRAHRLAKRNAKRLSYSTPTSSSRAPRESRTEPESPPGASSAEEDVAAVDRPPKGPATPPADASETNTSLETDVLDVTEHPLSEQSLTGSPATEEEIDRELIHDLDLAPKSPPNIRHRRTRSSENAMATPVGLGESDGEFGGVGSTPASPFGERDNNDKSCSPVTQFRRSLLALKGLGLQGADGVGGTNMSVGMGAHTPISPVVRDIIESTEEQEAAQMRILLEERSRAREMVQRLERDKQLPVDEAVRIATDVAEALHSAHEQGVIHRDIKPANILLAEDGTAKLADFDLVRAGDTTGGTRTGALGTFIYAAPEAMTDAKQAGPPCDIYGLGMTAVSLLSRKNPAELHDRSGVLHWEVEVSVEAEWTPRRLRHCYPRITATTTHFYFLILPHLQLQ